MSKEASQNQTLLQKHHQKVKDQGSLPCKMQILAAVPNMDNGGTQTTGPMIR